MKKLVNRSILTSTMLVGMVIALTQTAMAQDSLENEIKNTTTLSSENQTMKDNSSEILIMEQLPQLTVSDGATATTKIEIKEISERSSEKQNSLPAVAAFIAGIGSAILFIKLWYRRR